MTEMSAVAGGTGQADLHASTREARTCTDLLEWSTLSRPFLAELLVGYHTGVIRQFTPRFSSDGKVEVVPPAGMPLGCDSIPHAFYVHYASSQPSGEDSNSSASSPSRDEPRNWSIQACMPTDQSVSSWKDTYLRHEFVKELYLNISIIGYYLKRRNGQYLAEVDSRVLKITSSTTAGFFELPNYMNGGRSNRLLNGDPDLDHYCSDCAKQRYRSEIDTSVRPRTSLPVIDLEGNGSYHSDLVLNKGVSYRVRSVPRQVR